MFESLKGYLVQLLPAVKSRAIPEALELLAAYSKEAAEVVRRFQSSLPATHGGPDAGYGECRQLLDQADSSARAEGLPEGAEAITADQIKLLIAAFRLILDAVKKRTEG
jgi:hypothetical protein